MFVRILTCVCVFGRYTWVTGREPLTYYDMNLSAQDHQTFFTCDSDHLRPADASKSYAAPPLQAKVLLLDDILMEPTINSKESNQSLYFVKLFNPLITTSVKAN